MRRPGVVAKSSIDKHLRQMQNKHTKGLAAHHHIRYNRRMNEDQLMEELYIEKLEAQEAEMEARGMMDAPDSFQIAGIDESELPENELTDADWDAWADEYEERKNDLAN